MAIDLTVVNPTYDRRDVRGEPLVARRAPDAAEIGIAIPNWNGAEILPECLASVYEAARHAGLGTDVDIVVADDGSSDASTLVVRRDFPAVRLVELGRRSGFGAAASAAVEHSRSPYVLLLNTDATLDPGFFLAWPEAFADPHTFAVTSWMLRSDRRTVDSGRRVAVWDRGLIRHWVVQERGETAPSLYASGGGSVFHRDKFLEIGGFDPLYAPMYTEDLDLSYGAWKRGWKVVYEPRCVVFHRSSYSAMRSMSEWQKYLVETRNHFLFIWKNIADRSLIARHLAWLPLRLAAAPFHGRRMLAAGFLAALRRGGQALGRRRATRPFHVVSDRSIFDRLRPTAYDLAHSPYRGTAGTS